MIVTFETAQLAKDKGIIFKDIFPFNYTAYTPEGKLINSDVSKNSVQENIPTQSLLQCWFREEQKLHLSIHVWDDMTWYFKIDALKDVLPQYRLKMYRASYRELEFKNYEDALEAALFNGLKLIET